MKKQVTVVMTDYQYETIEPIRSRLERESVAFESYQCRSQEEIISAVREADAVITHFAPITEEVISQMHRCRLIVRGAVGVENIDVAAAKQYGIPVANVPDYGRDDVANHVLMLILALNKKVCLLNKNVKLGRWNFKDAKPIYRLQGKTIGLLGFGGIARLVAKKCRAFDMQLQAYDPFIPAAIARQAQVPLKTLDELLATSDYLSVHMPLTPQTQHLLDDAAFAKMKPGSVLINTARGGIVDESALVRALRSSHLAGAGLDVLTDECIPEGHPFRIMENVVLTPHSAWYSEESSEILLRSVAEEVLEAIQGRPIKNLVI